MSWGNFFSRLFNPRYRQTAIECEIEEELRFHMELLTRENLDRGLTPEAAAANARQQFGNYLIVKAACYRAKGREMARRKSIRALKMMTWVMLFGGISIYALSVGKPFRHMANLLIAIALLSRWLIYLRSSWVLGGRFSSERPIQLLLGESGEISN
jgi:hypothetical protein